MGHAVKAAEQYWQPSWKSFLFHQPCKRDGFATFCLKMFAENFQSLESFSAESFWSSSLASLGLGSFLGHCFFFFFLFYSPPFLFY